MTVVAHGDDGTLLNYDALRLDESTFAPLDALESVKTLFVPSHLHDFDGELLGRRYPKRSGRRL